MGDFAGNAGKIIEFSRRAQAAGAGLILFPELSVCGYPPRDLVERPSFVARNRETVDCIARATAGIAVICGFVTPAEAETGKSAMNSAALLEGARSRFVQSKMLLPTYDVFDEMRNFAPAKVSIVFVLRQADGPHHLRGCVERQELLEPPPLYVRSHRSAGPRRRRLPAEHLRFAFLDREAGGAPEHAGSIARTYQVPVVMVNQVGGNDSLVFDGSSIVLGRDGEVIAQGKSFEEDIVYFDSDLHRRDPPAGRGGGSQRLCRVGAGHARLCPQMRIQPGHRWSQWRHRFRPDRSHRRGGGRRRTCRRSRHAGPVLVGGSIADARELAKSRNSIRTASDHDILEGYGDTERRFQGQQEDETEENIQARARGTLLMALSNKFGAIVLSTGNKSELAVGYCTLYGDMVGGLAVISDVPKTMVYRLSRFVNSKRYGDSSIQSGQAAFRRIAPRSKR